MFVFFVLVVNVIGMTLYSKRLEKINVDLTAPRVNNKTDWHLTERLNYSVT